MLFSVNGRNELAAEVHDLEQTDSGLAICKVTEEV